MVISVESLGKKYRLRHQAQGRRYVALRDVIAYRAKSLFRGPLSALRRLGSRNPVGPSSCSPVVLSSCSPVVLSSCSPVVLSSARASSEDFWALKDVSFEVKHG